MYNEERSIAFLKAVTKLAERYRIKNLFVIADGHSVTRNSGDEAIRRCRNTLKEYELEIGGDPNEDWMK